MSTRQFILNTTLVVTCLTLIGLPVLVASIIEPKQAPAPSQWWICSSAIGNPKAPAFMATDVAFATVPPAYTANWIKLEGPFSDYATANARLNQIWAKEFKGLGYP